MRHIRRQCMPSASMVAARQSASPQSASQVHTTSALHSLLGLNRSMAHGFMDLDEMGSADEGSADALPVEQNASGTGVNNAA